jgi:hypothetical protein
VSLSAPLAAELLRKLAQLHAWFNQLYFDGALTPPVIALSDAERRLGAWKRRERRIEISRTLVVSRPWPEVTEVLLHEMAHQFVDEHLRVHDETAHGAAFQGVCKARGIDGRAAGLIQGSGRDDGASRLIARIQKLLALAGSPERHEAEAAMRKAHQLMLEHNLESLHTSDYEVCHLGDPTKRRTAMERAVVGLLTEFFFVRVIEIPVYLPLEGKTGHVFELCGAPANVAMSDHVFSFLLGTCLRLWRQAQRASGLPASERIPFQSGVIRGFGDKLRSERETLRGSGLVWVGDAELDRFYRARHPRIRMTQRSTRLSEGHAMGRAAGRDVVLHTPMTSGPSGGVRLLGSGSESQGS